MKRELKERVLHNRQSSLTSVALVGFLTVVVCRYPVLIEKPETLALLAAAVVPLFLRDSRRA